MDRRTKGLFLLVGAVALAAVGVAVWALLFRDPAPPAIPDIAPAVEDLSLIDIFEPTSLVSTS